jgi:predicted NBD/HSP70 family sugar kinase
LAAAAGHRLTAAGVGVPGLADFHRGRTLFLPNMPTGWRDYPVADRLSTTVGCPVFVLNDSRMAALGELWYSQGRGVRTMVVFTLGDWNWWWSSNRSKAECAFEKVVTMTACGASAGSSRCG